MRLVKHAQVQGVQQPVAVFTNYYEMEMEIIFSSWILRKTFFLKSYKLPQESQKQESLQYRSSTSK